MMKNFDKKPYASHQELSELLPWYVNKTLQGAELKAVEAHLTVCLVCKRELIQLQKLAQAVVQDGALDSAEHASFLRLKKRLHSGTKLDLNALPQQVSASGNVSQISKAKKRGWVNNAALRPALAMAAALLLSLSVLMPRHTGNDLQQASAFRTLSDGQKQEAINANEIRVVFAENVGQQQKAQILQRVHGQFISDNPTAQGVYTVRLESDIAAKHLIDVVDLLRKDSNVIFAEPAYALLSSTHVEE
jgi:hypothetical protein